MPRRTSGTQEAPAPLLRHQSPALAGSVARITMRGACSALTIVRSMLPQLGHMSARVARFAFRGTEAVCAVAADILPTWHGPPFKVVAVVYSLTEDCPSGEHRVRGRWYTAHMAAESKKAVVAAIIGNAVIAVIKFVAGSMTGSSAMISEGIHSLVDTGNGGLLYHGLRRGARPADSHHPFGHGMEVYFLTLIVAVSIFGIGGGMSIYEGIIHIQR